MVESGEKAVVVTIVQPVVPHYRVPLFEGLASQPGIELRVVACSSAEGHPASVKGLDSRIYSLVTSIKRLKFAFFWQSGVFRAVARSRCDVLVLWGDPSVLSNLGLLLWAKIRGIPTVWWGHGSLYRLIGKSKSLWQAIFFRLAYLYMTKSDVRLFYFDSEVEEWSKRGIDRNTLFATNNALDQGPIRCAKCKWTKEALDEFRLSHDLVEGKCLVFSSRLVSKTQLDVALRAIASLKARGIILVFLVIGSGELEGDYKKLSEDLGIDRQVRWLGAIYEESELAPWFLSSDVFVYPGSIGLSIFHAFGYGLPVVTHSDPAYQMPEFEVLRESVNGEVYVRNSPESLADAICRALENRERLAVEAIKTVDEYNVKKSIGRFVDAVMFAKKTGN